MIKLVLFLAWFLYQKKGLSGINRRTMLSIKLVPGKNRLCSQIDNSLYAEELVALRSLLNDTKRRLKILRKSEKKRKKRWKIKQANKAFIRNPYQAGKDVLNPFCETYLVRSKEQMDWLILITTYRLVP